MIHDLITCAYTLLALVVAYLAFRRWQKYKSLWCMISAIAAVLAAPAFWLSRVHGFLLLVPAFLLIVVGELFKKK